MVAKIAKCVGGELDLPFWQAVVVVKGPAASQGMFSLHFDKNAFHFRVQVGVGEMK